MLRSIIQAIRGIPALIGRVRHEPVMLATLGMVVLTAIEQANTGALGTEDTLILVAEGVIGWLARQLVTPTSKIAGSPDFVETLEKPFTGESGE